MAHRTHPGFGSGDGFGHTSGPAAAPCPEPDVPRTAHPPDEAVFRGQGRPSGRAAVLPHGRFLRAVLRRRAQGGEARSEEHTSEIQSLMRISYAVFCLKKNNSVMQYT